MTDITVVEVAACDSTQDEVRSRLTSGAHGAVIAVSATSQRAGRGRAGRSWQDPPGAALLVSIGRRGPVPVSVLEDLPRRVAEALLEVLDCGDLIHWKAPNDLVDTSGAKLAGILVDVRSTGMLVEEVIVGIGINVGGAPFTTHDGRAAVSLESTTGVVVDSGRVVADVVARIAGLLGA